MTGRGGRGYLSPESPISRVIGKPKAHCRDAEKAQLSKPTPFWDDLGYGGIPREGRGYSNIG
jgi:hypothetical protein